MEDRSSRLGDHGRYPARRNTMPKNTQWSIGRLFLWVLVAALIASHVRNFYQRDIVGFTNFSLDNSDVQSWITELDPSAKFLAGGQGSSRSGDSVDSDLDYMCTSKTATSEELLGHLKLKIREQLNDQHWTIHGWGGGTDSFHFRAYNGDTHFRIYAWLVPNAEASYARQLEERGETVTSIKILRVGYLKR